jgi:hypothetical protein
LHADVCGVGAIDAVDDLNAGIGGGDSVGMSGGKKEKDGGEEFYG